MPAIVLVPALVAVWFIYRQSHREAFVRVYIPTLLCLPGWCRWILPGLPDPTFQEAAILPIAAAFFSRDKTRWRWTALDFQVTALLGLMAASELSNAGLADAQNLMFDMMAAALLPYVLAKAIIEPAGMRLRFARTFVLCLALVFLTTLYEARFAYSPYRLVFGPLFPGQGAGWVTTFRYGLPRVAGPFGHAILAGMVFMIGLQFQLWLTCFGRSVTFSFKKAALLTGTMIAGLALTLARGPQIGAVLAWIVTRMGRGPHPRRRFLLGLSVLAIVGIPVFLWFLSYVSAGRAGAVSAAQETAAYRKELVDKYVQIACDHAVLGWGRNGWPKVSGMPSIDNYYLLLALMHGVIATALLVSILLSLMIRLCMNGIRYAPAPKQGGSLSFTLFGMFAGIAFSIATVYLGDSLVPIFFTIVGFSEGYLQAGGDRTAREGAAVAPASTARFAFGRIVS